MVRITMNYNTRSSSGEDTDAVGADLSSPDSASSPIEDTDAGLASPDLASSSGEDTDAFGADLSSPDLSPSSSRLPSRCREHGQLVPITIIDRSALLRAGLAQILAGGGFRVAASCSSLLDMPSEKILAERDGVLLVGFQEAAAVLPRIASIPEGGCRVVVLAERLDRAELVAAITAGAAGYLLKNETSAETLLMSLELVLLGAAVFPQGFAKPPTDSVQPGSDAVPATWVSDTAASGGQPKCPSGAPLTDDMARLTGRERAILESLTQGSSNKHIARELDIAEATVKVHIKSVLRKIRVSNRTQAAMWQMSRVSASRGGVRETKPDQTAN